MATVASKVNNISEKHGFYRDWMHTLEKEIVKLKYENKSLRGSSDASRQSLAT